jgi:hypothetical protein
MPPSFYNLTIDLSSNEISGSGEASNVPPAGGIGPSTQDSVQGASSLDIDRAIYLLGLLSGMKLAYFYCMYDIDSTLWYPSEQER